MKFKEVRGVLLALSFVTVAPITLPSAVIRAEAAEETAVDIREEESEKTEVQEDNSVPVADEEISVNAFTYASNMRTLFRLLQKQGLANWKAAQKHSILKPFAWLYQANRYLSKGLRRKKAVSKLKTEYENAKKRNMMFDLLGVKTAAKGIAVYKDGKYIKE